MPSITDPVHKAQGRAGQKPIEEVVLDHNSSSSNSCGLAQQAHGVVRVMENVHKHHHILASITARNSTSVEVFNWNMGLAANQDIEAFYFDVGAFLRNKGGEQTIAATHVQHARTQWNEISEVVAQDPYTPGMNALIMDSLGKFHFRRIPKILTKKLDRMVWNPSAVRVTPGITHRMVYA